jgi:hypothetical protein
MSEILLDRIIPEMNKIIEILTDENITDYSLTDNRSGWLLTLTKKKEVKEVSNR